MSLSRIPSDVVAILSKYLCGEDWMQLIHTGCKRLIKQIASTKIDLRLTPNHYGYLNILKLIYSLQKSFPSARRVAFEACEIVKLPLNMPIEISANRRLIENLVWTIESLSFRELNPFSAAFASLMAFNGLERMNNLFPALRSLIVDNGPIFGNHEDPVRIMAPFIPSSCVNITLLCNMRTTRDPDTYDAFRDRVVSIENSERRYVSLSMRLLRLSQNQLSLPQFQALESLTMQCVDSIDTSLLPRSLTSLKLLAAYQGSQAARDSPLTLRFSQPPPNLTCLCSAIRVIMTDCALPRSLTRLRAKHVKDEHHYINASFLPLGLRHLDILVSLTDGTPPSDGGVYRIADHLFYNIHDDDNSWQSRWPPQLELDVYGQPPEVLLLKRLQQMETPQTEYTLQRLACQGPYSDAIFDAKTRLAYFKQSIEMTINWDVRLINFLRDVSSNDRCVCFTNSHVTILTCASPLNGSFPESWNDFEHLISVALRFFVNLYIVHLAGSVIGRLLDMPFLPSWIKHLHINGECGTKSLKLSCRLEHVTVFSLQQGEIVDDVLDTVLLKLPINLVACTLYLRPETLQLISNNINTFLAHLPRTLETLSISLRKLSEGFERRAGGMVWAVSDEFVDAAPLLPANLKDLNVPPFIFKLETLQTFVNGCRLVPSLRRLLLTYTNRETAPFLRTIHCHTAWLGPI